MYQFIGNTTFDLVIYGNKTPGNTDDLIDLSDSAFNAYVNAGKGDDTIIGSAFDDYLLDWKGDDQIDGGAGNDRIDGGTGSDVLIGGSGFDAFFFGGTGKWDDGDQDTIKDFSFDEDALVIRPFGDFTGALITSLDSLLSLVSPDFQVMFTSEGLEITLHGDDGTSQQILLENHDDATFVPPTTIVMTYGQSLAVGTTYWPARDLLNETALYPDQAFELDFTTATLSNQTAATFTGLTAMVETKWETVGSGMINRLIYEYESNGYLAPDFIHTNTAVGGRSILELMTGSDDIYATIQEGLDNTETGKHFVVLNASDQFEHYIDEGGSAYLTKTSTTSNSNAYFDTFKTHLELAIQASDDLDGPLSKQIVLNWIQGQADGSLSIMDYDYDYHLNLLIEEITDLATGILGDEATVLASISQNRGYSRKEISIQQLHVATEDEFAYFGMPEYFFQGSYPSLIGSDHTHLSSEGYFMAGQTLGLKMYDALTGQVNEPILFSTVELLSDSELLIDFTGADGGLVYDARGYSSDNGMVEPSFFGFGLYSETGYRITNGPNITDAQIVGQSTVQLSFDQELDGTYRLYLGRNEEDLIDVPSGNYNGTGFGGTTLRSADTDIAIQPTGSQVLEDDTLYEFAPVQFATITISDLPEL